MRTVMCVRPWMWLWIVALGLHGGLAVAAPGAGAEARYTEAARHFDDGEYDSALVEIDAGLAIAPRHQRLLRLRGDVLLKQRKYEPAIAAYEAYLRSGITGKIRAEVERRIADLRAARSTTLEVVVANGPATVYLALSARARSELCAGASTCSSSILPGEHRVIAERPGFERWTGRVKVASGKTVKLPIALVEKPSKLVVRATPADALVTIDDAAHDAARPIAPGTHRVAVSRPGHRTERREVVAREGAPIELDVALAPLVPVRVEPATAALELDGQPVALEDGHLAIPAGAHVLVARAPGHLEHRRELPEARPADHAIDIALVREAPRAPVASPPVFTIRRTIAAALGGVAVLGAAGGVVLGMQARQLERDTFALCPSPSSPCDAAAAANAQNARARSRANYANAAYAAAGIAAVTAAVLWFTGEPESPVQVAPRVGQVSGVDIAVRF